MDWLAIGFVFAIFTEMFRRVISGYEPEEDRRKKRDVSFKVSWPTKTLLGIGLWKWLKK